MSASVRSLRAPRPVTPLSILVAELDLLVDELAGTDLAPAVRTRLQRARDLAAGVDPYVERCTTPESPALAHLARRTREQDWSRSGRPLEQEMLSGHVEGQALKMLVGACRARRVLEIGMFTGYSALAMAEALPPDGVLIACEVDPHVAAMAREWLTASPAGARVDVRVGAAATTLRNLADEAAPFDFVFVDADKTGYAGYLRTVLDAGLLAPDGLLCFDNTLLQGHPWLPGPLSANAAAIDEFNRVLADDARVEQVLLPLRDGLTLVRWAR